jgi:hypothetical protein
VPPAQGWTILNQDRQWVNLINARHDAIVYAAVGKANTQDIVSEANMLINQNIRSGGLTNVQQNSSARPVPLQGKNFQQFIELDYTADSQTNQGTMQVWGGWIVLFNASTQTSAFFNYFANTQDTVKLSLSEAGSMLASME